MTYPTLKTYSLPLRILADLGHPPTASLTAKILRRAQGVVFARMVLPRPVIVLALSLPSGLRHRPRPSVP